MRRLSILAVAALAACSSTNGYYGPVNPGCQATLIAPPTLVSPANNATGVADGNFTLSMTWGTTTNPNSGWTWSLQSQTAATVPLGSFTAGAASGSNTTYSVPIPALQAKTTYTLIMATSGQACAGAQGAGAFTTQ